MNFNKFELDNYFAVAKVLTHITLLDERVIFMPN